VDWPAVRVGALVAIAICLPVSIVGAIVVDSDKSDPGSGSALFYVAVLVGFAIGGWAAAKRSVELPYSSGAISAMCAFVVIAVVSIVANAIEGDEIRVVSLVANAFLAYGAGLLGAAIVARSRS
jgi:putative membrane protein (TIGR04086 family)